MMLGNLSIDEASSRMGINEKDFKKFLDGNGYHKIDNCDEIIRHRKGYHIFDIPFTFMCGTEETAKAIYGYLSQYDIKEYVQFSREKIED